MTVLDCRASCYIIKSGLTDLAALAKDRGAMNRILSITAVAAMLAVTACNKANEPEVIDTNPDPMASQIANAAPVELPPSVTDSGIYRCKDNSVVYVDFLGDKTEANVRTAKDGPATHVKAAEAGKPMTAEDGTSVTGSGKTIQIAMKSGAAQSCTR